MTTIPEPTAWPTIVSQEEWDVALTKHLRMEKGLTRMRDAVSASRRRLPMVEITTPYTFRGEEGEVSLLDLFGGHRQLVLQHFMFHPDWDEGCDGCSMMTDHIGPLVHMRARDTTFVAVARAPLAKLLAYRERMGWEVPFYSSFESSFNQDLGLTVNDEELHGVSYFVRNGDRIFRTFFSTDRGDEDAISTFILLDRTAFGRQESWEDSPAGWPQTEPYGWWRRHDQYEEVEGDCCH
ncbi:MAG: DUF899 domain-containing protein [Thermomicrobiales bacterium]|nr:DUF899 domain-containing protein [Thermomicrobiales bacterium]